jgi:hypothetical protein
MFDKIVSGLISISMALFSSYEGNNADFSFLQANLQENHITISAELENAFENDFEEIFKLGTEVHIYYYLKIENKTDRIFSSIFTHKVEYDPVLRRYFIDLGEQNKQVIASDYTELIDYLSNFEYVYQGYVPPLIRVSLTAYLDKLYLPNLQKEYDLSVLWKKQKPSIRKSFQRVIQ